MRYPILSGRPPRFLPAFLVLLLLCASPYSIPARYSPPVDTIAPMLEQVLPAVVNISTLTRFKVQRNPLLDDPFFRRFFDLPEDQPQERQRRHRQRARAHRPGGRGLRELHPDRCLDQSRQSGGPLVNMHGELVGINTAIVGPSGGNIGIGFAIPSNMARATMQSLKQYGEVRRGELGALLQNLTPDLAQAFGLRQGGGAVVAKVLPGSAAEQAGLQRGDRSPMS